MEALRLTVKDEVEKEKNEMAEFFAKNNVSKENTNSYTVLLENDKTSEWKEVLKKMDLVKDPMKLINGGTQYKKEVLGSVVSMSLYDNPRNGQSKLLVQGSMFHIRAFIVDMMPPLYKKVCEKVKKKDTKETKKSIALRAIKGKDVTFKCDQCGVTYRRKFYLIKHIAEKHDPDQTKKIEKASKVANSKIKSTPNPTPYKVPKGLSITPVNHQFVMEKENESVKETETTNNEDTNKLTKNQEENLTRSVLERTLDLETELGNLLEVLDDRVKEVVNGKTKEPENISDLENTNNIPVINLTKPANVPEDDMIEESPDKAKPVNVPEDDTIEESPDKNKEGMDVLKLIAKIVSDMTDNAIVKSSWVPEEEEDEEVEEDTIDFEIFKEFEEASHIEGQQVRPNENFVCGECGLFGFVKSKIEMHMERTHNDAKYEDLKAENRKIFKELGETKSTLYEVQSQLQECEVTLAETMKEVMCLEEDNNDKAKIVDRLLAERSTVGDYEEDGEEQGFWDANDETNTLNEEPEVVEVNTTSNRARSASLDGAQQQCPKCDFVPSRPIYMKSHMLIKHKEDQTECLKCKKIFPTKKDLNNHIQKTHTNNMYNCSHCEAKFLAAHALKQHTQAIHKDVQTLPLGHPDRSAQQNRTQQTSSKMFKCRMCGKTNTSGAMLDKHMKQCAQDKTKQPCKFFLEGRCTRGSWCTFSHEIEGSQGGSQGGGFRNLECRRGPQCHFLAQSRCQFFHQAQYNQHRQQQNYQRQERRQSSQLTQQQQQNMMQPMQHQQQQMQVKVQPCRRGQGCVFWAAGTCFFFHGGDGVQDMWQDNQQEQHDQQPHKTRACRYQEDCNRVPECPFSHYNEDFPQLGRNNNRQ